jgi:hypothetical protein
MRWKVVVLSLAVGLVLIMSPAARSAVVEMALVGAGFQIGYLISAAGSDLHAGGDGQKERPQA